MRAGVAAALTLSVLLAACMGAGSSTGEGKWREAPAEESARLAEPADVVLASALVTFDACDELLTYVTEHAVEMVGPWGLNGHGGLIEEDAGGDDAIAEEAAGDAESTVDGAAPAEGRDFSGTNVQEAGVDEPDSVKTDGRRLFMARGEWLEIVDVSGDEPELASTTELNGWSHQLLLAGDRLLVFGEGGAGVHSRDQWSVGTQLWLYDVADPARPELVSTLRLDGWVLSARLIDGTARVALRAEPVGLPFMTPEGSGIRAEREATERNREIIRASAVDNWVPYYVHEVGGHEQEGTLLPCERVHHPEQFAGLGTTSVLSLDLAGDLSPRASTGVLAGGETVYASSERLYVATNRWVDWEALSEPNARDLGERYTTELHAFDIADPGAARYIGSGSVRGHVLNQWAMSTHEGVLRVATTAGSPWWDSEQPLSESFVTTLAEREGALVELGQVGGLGRDERIYAVRFMGDVGYVVTFRETDPLYTLDLSDPADPKVLGELKIMGYSAYLHPIDEGLVLGVGQDADERGRTTGLQLSLFDVSDLADPQRIHQVTMPDAHSGVEWDHHAFLHWPATGLTVVPYETWLWDEEAETEQVDSGALAYTLDGETGFAELGRLTHLPADMRDSTDPRYWDVAWRAGIHRSIVVDDALYTVSDLGVKASDLSTLADAGWVSLPARDE